MRFGALSGRNSPSLPLGVSRASPLLGAHFPVQSLAIGGNSSDQVSRSPRIRSPSLSGAASPSVIPHMPPLGALGSPRTLGTPRTRAQRMAEGRRFRSSNAEESTNVAVLAVMQAASSTVAPSSHLFEQTTEPVRIESFALSSTPFSDLHSRLMSEAEDSRRAAAPFSASAVPVAPSPEEPDDSDRELSVAST